MMATETLIEQCDDYKRIEQAIQFLEGSFRNQPSLDEIAASVHLSKYHFQRLFKRWAGVTPSIPLALQRRIRSVVEAHPSLRPGAGLSQPGHRPLPVVRRSRCWCFKAVSHISVGGGAALAGAHRPGCSVHRIVPPPSQADRYHIMLTKDTSVFGRCPLPLTHQLDKFRSSI